MILFNKSKAEHGWLGNMTHYKITSGGRVWPTAEALFQALRFFDGEIREQIRQVSNPYEAKQLAKEIALKEVDGKRRGYDVEPRSALDLDNMRLVVRLKCEQHPNLQRLLLLTGDEVIAEDVSTRADSDSNNFWGLRRVVGPDGETWVGHNTLGKIWMAERERLNRLHTEPRQKPLF